MLFYTKSWDALTSMTNTIDGFLPKDWTDPECQEYNSAMQSI